MSISFNTKVCGTEALTWAHRARIITCPVKNRLSALVRSGPHAANKYPAPTHVVNVWYIPSCGRLSGASDVVSCLGFGGEEKKKEWWV